MIAKCRSAAVRQRQSLPAPTKPASFIVVTLGDRDQDDPRGARLRQFFRTWNVTCAGYPDPPVFEECRSTLHPLRGVGLTQAFVRCADAALARGHESVFFFEDDAVPYDAELCDPAARRGLSDSAPRDARVVLLGGHHFVEPRKRAWYRPGATAVELHTPLHHGPDAHVFRALDFSYGSYAWWARAPALQLVTSLFEAQLCEANASGRHVNPDADWHGSYNRTLAGGDWMRDPRVYAVDPLMFGHAAGRSDTWGTARGGIFDRRVRWVGRHDTDRYDGGAASTEVSGYDGEEPLAARCASPNCRSGPLRFVFIIASYNNADWVQRNIRSVCTQRYPHWKAIYVDDASTDGTMDLARREVARHRQESRFTFVSVRERQHQAHARFVGYHHPSCTPDQVAVLLDGDDWLAHDRVLTILEHQYTAQDLLVTYGRYVYFRNNKTRGSSSSAGYPADVIERRAYRQHTAWLASHLRTAKIELLRQIPESYLKEDGKWIHTNTDVAEMMHLLERAGSRHANTGEVLLVYNRDNSERHANSYYNRARDADQLRYRNRLLRKYAPGLLRKSE
jgi:glycosyltransferase involved in cell wall biosynthesis